jgi:ring-1,2-phenylacetyl-CoA epoxidase subunit PaaA
MRQDFIEQYVPKIWELGMTLPDAALKKNADGVWEYTQPDWDEFFRVINGDGPCNKERLAVRRYAEENGRWVREAMMNPAAKRMVPYA